MGLDFIENKPLFVQFLAVFKRQQPLGMIFIYILYILQGEGTMTKEEFQKMKQELEA